MEEKSKTYVFGEPSQGGGSLDPNLLLAMNNGGGFGGGNFNNPFWALILLAFLGSSLPDERAVALYVKDYLEDPDGYDEVAFTRFYADCIGKGEMPDWEDVL